jgi:hypothetical protein
MENFKPFLYLHKMKFFLEKPFSHFLFLLLYYVYFNDVFLERSADYFKIIVKTAYICAKYSV